MVGSNVSAPRRLYSARVWERPSTGAVAWLVQRVTGLLLLVFVPVKVWSGWALVGKAPGGDVVTSLHLTPWVDAVLVTAVVFHGLYGVRVILIDLGLAQLADRLFVLFTALGIVLSAIGIAVGF